MAASPFFARVTGFPLYTPNRGFFQAPCRAACPFVLRLSVTASCRPAALREARAIRIHCIVVPVGARPFRDNPGFPVGVLRDPQGNVIFHGKSYEYTAGFRKIARESKKNFSKFGFRYSPVSVGSNDARSWTRNLFAIGVKA